MGSWDSNQYWLKAKGYMDRANEAERSELFPLWSALGLEFLARAALTKIHPVLNADHRDPENIFYACGLEVAAQPRSLPLHSVFLRLERIVPTFKKAQREACDFLSLRRNREFHSGDLGFDGLRESEWLPRFYEVCQILCAFMEHSLVDLLGNKVAASADKLIQALAAEIKASVMTRIAESTARFRAIGKEDLAAMQARAKSTFLSKLLFNPELRKGKQRLVRERCRICDSEGVLLGDLIKELEPQFGDGSLFVEGVYLAEGFSCSVCGLELKSVEEIAVAGWEPRFSRVSETSLHELYEPDGFFEYENM
jgi:hypothetical protein